MTKKIKSKKKRKEKKEKFIEEKSDVDKEDTEVYLPSQKLEKNEVLEVDQTAYDLLLPLDSEWPCLSFDFLQDDLGNNRTRFPMTTYLVSGTQADSPSNNALVVMKLSHMNKTTNDSDLESKEDTQISNPTFKKSIIKHTHGGINRIRASKLKENIISVWGDDSNIRIYDINSHIEWLDTFDKSISLEFKPIFTFDGHSNEGFSMDWSYQKQLRLLTGDMDHKIYLWEPTQASSWIVHDTPFSDHNGSVEDIQWSPTEANAFASCSTDKTIKVWDCRERTKAALSITAHDCDVNVLSWNRMVNYLIVSGGDDGSFKIWDLRMLVKKNDSPIASFQWHSSSITSIEWNPLDDSVLAVSGSDDQISLWDLSVEADTEMNTNSIEKKIPPQLLFVHQGQEDIKEVHWHSQIKGLLGSTSLSGFNIFKTISV